MNKQKKNILKIAGFKEEVEAVEHGFCPICKNPVSKSDFKDERSIKEYNISGMCQRCQDDIFK